MQIVKEIEVSYGHRLPNHKGACRNIHGHNSRVKFTFSALDASNNHEGMVADFYDIKNLLMEEVHDVVDHAFVVWEGDTVPFDVTIESVVGIVVKNSEKIEHFNIGLSLIGFLKSAGMKMLILEKPPTAESLAEFFGVRLRDVLNKEGWDFRIDSVEWQETSNNTAIWTNDQR